MADYITIETVYDILERSIAPVPATELLPLSAAEGRILAETITAPFDAPAFDNSARDGFAFRAAELAPGAAVRLRVAGVSYAGAPFNGVVAPGEAVRIMTGAKMPEGADTVIPFERTRSEETPEGAWVVFDAQRVKPGENVRLQGEEMRAGDAVMEPGEVLTPAWIGLAAALGRAELRCRRLTVALFSTGDELVAPGTPGPLPAGAVYNANSALLAAQIRRWGADVVDLGILPDDPEVQRAALSEAARRCDFLVATGGVGEGEHDYTNRVLAEMGGGVTHHHVSMRPGKPFSFGRIPGEHPVWFMALPGNPVAAAVSAALFLRRALLLAGGATAPLNLPKAPAVAGRRIKGRTGRTDLVRGRLEMEAGRLVFTPTASQSSGQLTTLTGMNAMAVLGLDSAGVEEGASVECLLI